MDTLVSTRTDLSIAPLRSVTALRRADHRFFLIASVIAIVLVAVGFGREFLPDAPAPTRPRSLLVMIHASVFATWIVLFAVQVSLITSGRVSIHKQLGVILCLLAAAMLALGYATAIHAARTGYAPIPRLDSLGFLVVPLGDLVVFGPLVGAALYWRKSSDIHKRLLWLATAMLTFPAITRLPHVQGRAPLIFGVFLALMMLGPIYERVVSGRVHRVMLWGSIAVFASVPLRGLLGRTAAWHEFARWLVS
jgi:hypothetical protein